MLWFGETEVVIIPKKVKYRSVEVHEVYVPNELPDVPLERCHEVEYGTIY